MGEHRVRLRPAHCWRDSALPDLFRVNQAVLPTYSTCIAVVHPLLIVATPEQYIHLATLRLPHSWKQFIR
jgi:hypothetical protein